MRAIARVTGVSINTVTKLLVDAGKACDAYHDEQVRGVKATRIQCDEVWAFCYCQAEERCRRRKPPRKALATFGRGPRWMPTAS